MKIRLLGSGDGERVAEIDRLSKGSAHWSAADYERIAVSTPAWFGLVACDDAGEIFGAAAVCVADGEAELLNIAVLPEHRRRGAGAALLNAAIHRARTFGARRMWLEVRESNSTAIAFYHRHGFAGHGRRPAYYSSPAEDALTFSRDLVPGAAERPRN